MGSISFDDQMAIQPKFDWKGAIKAKQQQVADRTPKEWLLSQDFKDSLNSGPAQNTNLISLDVCRRSGKLTEVELEITEKYSAQQLLQKISAGILSSLEVTTAFCKRAVIAQQLLSCLTEVFYSDALGRAKFLDEYYRREGKVSGPLHGLPISVKVSIRAL